MCEVSRRVYFRKYIGLLNWKFIEIIEQMNKKKNINEIFIFIFFLSL